MRGGALNLSRAPVVRSFAASGNERELLRIFEFEEAVKRRGEWVESNHAALRAAFDSDSPDEDQLRSWRREAHATRQGLSEAQAQLATFIKHTFPADFRSP